MVKCQFITKRANRLLTGDKISKPTRRIPDILSTAVTGCKETFTKSGRPKAVESDLLTFARSTDACRIVRKRATKYQDFADQLKVAEVLAGIELKRSLAVLEQGIAQLNEILAASAVVNGFEGEVFRDGELPLRGGSELGNMVARYGWQLGSLARIDFSRATSTAAEFQFPEARLLTKLLIVQRVL